MRLENFLQDVKAAIHLENPDMIEQLGIRDNFCYTLFGPKNDRFDKEELIHDKVLQYVKHSGYYTRKKSMTREVRKELLEIDANCYFYDHSNGITVLQIQRIYDYYGTKPGYALLISFHPYQARDNFKPSYEELIKQYPDKKASEVQKIWSKLYRQEFTEKQEKLALANEAYHFGEFILADKLSTKVRGMQIRNNY